MPSRPLDRFRGDHPRLAPYVDRIQAELAEGKRDAFVPALLAQKLDIDEGLALALMMAFDKAGVLEPRYDVYCPNDEFLGSYPSLSVVPKSLYCPFDDVVHPRHELAVLLVFVPRGAIADPVSDAGRS